MSSLKLHDRPNGFVYDVLRALPSQAPELALSVRRKAPVQQVRRAEQPTKV